MSRAYQVSPWHNSVDTCICSIFFPVNNELLEAGRKVELHYASLSIWTHEIKGEGVLKEQGPRAFVCNANAPMLPPYIAGLGKY